ncbi:MAG: hypothetical protein L0323_24375, partial [Planctomycetes bacterium]|nr:hypothetical protein [Planctomycetota bacterium]
MFRLGGLRPGRWSIRAAMPAGEGEFACEAKADAGSDGVVLRVRDAARAEAGLEDGVTGPRVRIRVFDTDGRPVEGRVRLQFVERDRDLSHEDRSLFEGICEAAIPVSESPRVWVEVLPEGADGADSGAAHGAFGPFFAVAGEIPIRLEAARPLVVRVVDPDGRGVPGQEIELEGWMGGRPDSGWRSIFHREGETDTGGVVEFPGVGSGTYEVTVKPVGHWLAPLPATARAGAEPATLVLKPALVFRVTLLDPDGRPVPGADLLAIPDEDVNAISGTSDARGVVVLGLIPSEKYDLHGSCSGRADVQPFLLEGWTPTDAEFRFRRAYPLEVRVRDPSGRPVPDATIVALWEGPSGEVGAMHGLTGPDGLASLGGVPSERVRVRVFFEAWEDERAPAAEVEARAGGATVDLVLDTGAEAVLLLPREQWKRSFEALLAVEGSSAASVSGRFVDGRCRIRGLKVGSAYAVAVTDEERLYAVLRGYAPGGPPVALDLAEGREVRGRVLVREGETIESVGVLVGEAALFRTYGFEANGAFALAGIPAGPCRLRAEIRDAEDRTRSVVVESRPGEPVT